MMVSQLRTKVNVATVVVFVALMYYLVLPGHIKRLIKYSPYKTANITISRPAYRVCKPGPPLGYPEPESNLKNCLVIGDSISVGYTPVLRRLLSKVCRVQRSPVDTRYGGARDSRYGRHCLPMFLRTTTGNISFYDVIVFNFGIHDVNWDSSVMGIANLGIPLSEYINNLVSIKRQLGLTGAKLVFLTTTPNAYNMTINRHIMQYNREAVKICSATPKVMVLDLSQVLVDHCRGNISDTLKKCGIFRGDYTHFNEAGSKIIATHIAELVKNILKTTTSSSRTFVPKLPGVSPDWISCPGEGFVVRCPPGSSCMKTKYTDIGVGCCHLPNPVDCGTENDYCDQGWVCDPKCSILNCFCQKNITKTNYF